MIAKAAVGKQRGAHDCRRERLIAFLRPIRSAAVSTVIAQLIHLPITASIELTVFPPISLAIFLSNIRLGEYHIR